MSQKHETITYPTINHVNVMRRKMGDEKTPMDTQTRLIELFIASSISAYLDVPTDKQVIIRQYYENNVSDLVIEIVSEFNELTPINCKVVMSNIYHMWYTRYMVASGRYANKLYINALYNSNALDGETRADLEKLAAYMY